MLLWEITITLFSGLALMLLGKKEAKPKKSVTRE